MSGRSVEHATFVLERRYEASPETSIRGVGGSRGQGWFADSNAHLELDFRTGGRERRSRPSASSTAPTCTCRKRKSQPRWRRWNSNRRAALGRSCRAGVLTPRRQIDMVRA
jgi:hypothetical protein